MKRLTGLLLLFAAYFATARMGLLLDAVAGFATLVWPPTGIALAALVLYGTWLWPAVFAGALLANLLAGASLPVALGIACGNSLEALTAAWALKWLDFQPRLDRLDDAVALLSIGAVLSTGVSAGIGVLSLWLGGAVGGDLTWQTLRAWWLGDMLGDLVVAPLALVWLSGRPQRRSRWRRLEAAVLFAGLAAYCLWVFSYDRRAPGLHPVYVLFPLLVLGALRFGTHGAVTGVFVVSAIAVTRTAAGEGPFVRASLSESLLFLQVFLAATAVTNLILGAAVAERDRAVEARDEFLAIASHELRTPLTALSLHLQGMLRRLSRGEAPAPAELQRELESSHRLTGRLATMIHELLEISRMSVGRFDLQKEPLELAALVRESLLRLQPLLTQSECAAELKIESEARGEWDRMRIDQVLDNLIGNAAKYGAGKPIEVRLAASGGRARLTVRDGGIGIDPADQARIFERFERAVPRQRFGGLGLGLWIARMIVEAHGGTIALESKAGAGALFTVELPLSYE